MMLSSTHTLTHPITKHFTAPLPPPLTCAPRSPRATMMPSSTHTLTDKHKGELTQTALTLARSQVGVSQPLAPPPPPKSLTCAPRSPRVSPPPPKQHKPHLCAQVTTCHHDAVCCLHDGIKVLQAVVRLKLGDKLNLVADA
jgi:hypothetical protein